MSGTDPMRGERRTVTALFADVKGSTALGEALDPEDVVDLVGGCVRDICEVVERFGGTVNELAGDGVLALFGAPTTHEDDPERAIRAGLEIQNAMRRHTDRAAREFGVEAFGVRVGVETGLVVVGAVGGGTRVEYGATGDAMNTAARLEAQAVPGEVLVGPTTRRQVGERFLWGPVRGLELKGKASVVEAAVALAPMVPDASEMPGIGPKLVGRERELEACVEAIRRLSLGSGGSVFLIGDAGAGKTRLLAEMHRAAEAASVPWREGRCAAIDRSRPFAGFIDLLRRSRGTHAETPDSAQVLAALLGEGRPALETLSPEAVRLRTMESLDRVLGGSETTAPTVVAMEDLHWADPSTLAVVERIARSAGERRVLLVGTCRPEQEGASRAMLAAMTGAPHADLVQLRPLPKGEDRRLLEELVGPGMLSPDVERGILGSARGNPLYLVELVHSLEDAALPSDARGVDVGLVADADPGRGIDRVILSRLDRLPSALRSAAAELAVFAQPFSLGLAAIVLAPNETSATVEGLRKRRVIEGPDDALGFAHPLIRDVAHATLLKRRRRDLHRAVAEALESEAAAGPDELAYHWEEAGDAARALGHHVRAARRAEGVSALLEALAHVDAACRMALRSPPPEADAIDLLLWRAHLRSRTGAMGEARVDAEEALARARAADDTPRRQRASMELGLVLSGAVDYRRSIGLFEKAMELADARGDPVGQVEAASALALAWANRLRFDLASTYEQQALERAEATGEEASLMAALDAAKQVELQLGNFDAEVGHIDRLQPIAERRGDLWQQEFICFELAIRAAAMSGWAEAMDLLDRGSAIGERIGDLGNEPLFGGLYTWIDAVQGRYEEALRRGRHDLAAARARGHAEWEAWMSVTLSHALCQWGDFESAADILESGLIAAGRSGAGLHGVRAAGRLAWVGAQLGGERDVGALLAQAVSELDEVRTPPGGAFILGWDAYACTASVMAQRGEGEAALTLLAHIIEVARDAGLHEALASSLLVAAEAHTSLEDRSNARAAAEEALALAEAHDMPGLAWRSAGALAANLREGDEADRFRSRAVAIVDGLTARTQDPIIREQLHAFATRTLEGATWE